MRSNFKRCFLSIINDNLYFISITNKQEPSSLIRSTFLKPFHSEYQSYSWLSATACVITPTFQVESYLKSYQPVITPSNTHYTVGRCTLQCHTPPHTAPLYAHTRSAAVLLEKLACAVQHQEPVLLTGETGEFLILEL